MILLNELNIAPIDLVKKKNIKKRLKQLLRDTNEKIKFLIQQIGPGGLPSIKPELESIAQQQYSITVPVPGGRKDQKFTITMRP